MDTIIALTGASGNMGRPTLTQLLELDFVKKIKILLLNEKKEKRSHANCANNTATE